MYIHRRQCLIDGLCDQHDFTLLFADIRVCSISVLVQDVFQKKIAVEQVVTREELRIITMVKNLRDEQRIAEEESALMASLSTWTGTRSEARRHIDTAQEVWY